MVFVRAHSSLLNDQQRRRGGGRGAGYFAESDDRKPVRVAGIRGKWRTLQAAPFLFPSVLAYLLQMIGPSRAGIGGAVRTRRHRHNNVFALFAVEVFHTQQHLVLCQAELRLVAEGQGWRIEGEGKEKARIAYAHLIDGRLKYSFEPSITPRSLAEEQEVNKQIGLSQGNTGLQRPPNSATTSPDKIA